MAVAATTAFGIKIRIERSGDEQASLRQCSAKPCVCVWNNEAIDFKVPMERR